MGADKLEAGVGDGPLDFSGAVFVVAGSFNLLVAEGGEFFEGAGVVLGEQIADGVELDAEGQAKGFGVGVDGQ